MMKNLYFIALVALCSFTLQARDHEAFGPESISYDYSHNQAFEENKGQIKGEDGHRVLFFHREAEMSMFLMPTGIAYQFRNSTKTSKETDNGSAFEGDHLIDADSYEIETYRMDMELVGANPNAKITRHGKSKDFVKYYQEETVTAYSYEKIVYENIYPNIDWVIYKKDGGVKYDFILKPNGNPDLIKFKGKWVEKMSIDASGNLILENRMGSVQDSKPVSFQQGERVETSFALKDGEVSFVVDDYDKSETLIIDPDLIWGSYYGGEGTDGINSVTTDGSGNVYFCGITYGSSTLASGGFLNTNGALQGGTAAAFLVKFNQAGDRLWATYYGNSYTGSFAVAADSEDNVYLSGFTYDFVGVAFNGYQNSYAGLSDSYIVKFNPEGERLWATYLGGNEGESGLAIAVDSEDNLYATGNTSSNNFPVLNAFQEESAVGGIFGGDAFLSKFDPSGGLLWSTYFGGAGFDDAFSVACAANGDVFITGRTNSTGIATSGSHQTTIGGGSSDAFLAKFNSTGALQWSTYYGGSGEDRAFGCATDNTGNVFISGRSESSNNIAFNGFQNTIAPSYLAKFDDSGQRLWGTYYGESVASDFNVGYACATDSDNNVYLAGVTDNISNISSQGFQNNYGGGTSDSYLVKFDPSGSRIWGTYYGGSNNDRIRGMHVDAASQIYVVGSTQSSNNIFFEGFQSSAQNESGFVAKIGCPNPQLLDFTAEVCANNSIELDPYPAGGSLELLGSGDLSNNTYTAPDVSEATDVTIAYTLSENTSCPSASSDFSITVLPNVVASVDVTTADQVICEGDTAAFVANIQNAGATPSIQWFLNGQLILEDSLAFVSDNLSDGDAIQCIVGSSNVCATPTEVESDLLNLTVNPLPNPSVVFADLDGGTLVSTLGFTSYQWFLNGVLISGANSPNYNPTSTGTYSVVVTNEFGCENSASTFVSFLSADREAENQISIYPNPNDGYFTLDFGTRVPQNISVTNVLGEVVFRKSQVEPLENLDLRNFTAGVYFVIYQMDGHKRTERFVIQH